MLLRQYIGEALKNYFASGIVVGQVPTLPQLSSLASSADFHALWAEAYTSSSTSSWLTPSELLFPHYGRALASFLSSAGVGAVVEIGAGRGSTAAAILSAPGTESWLSSYISLEQSRGLAEQQRRRLAKDLRFQVLEGSGSCETSWRDIGVMLRTRNAPGKKVAVLVLEVLDNLPHDRVIKRGGQWFQTHIGMEEESIRQVEEPISDPIILEVLSQYEVYAANHNSEAKQSSWTDSISAFGTGGRERSVATGLLQAEESGIFLPTSSFEMMRMAQRHIECPGFLIADFDELPDVVIPGREAPLVAGADKDYSTYLLRSVYKGNADILFPTDFPFLKYYLGEIIGRGKPIHLHKNAAFMSQHADLRATTLGDGYNPLMTEFPNTSILTANFVAC